VGVAAPCPVTTNHDISVFNCGHSSLNQWLLNRAIKNKKGGTSRTFVACNNNTVIGYYSLAVGAVTREEASGKVRRNMPEPVPVMILGRLAVDQQWQGKQIGSGMLRDTILHTLVVAEQAGIRTLVVHAFSDSAKHFYLKCGFHESPLDDMTLMITLNEAWHIYP